MPPPPDPRTITFRDLLAWGWESRGHCRTCEAAYPADIARMAALPTGDGPIASRFRRGRYACGVCDSVLTGITLVGRARSDGPRPLIEMGECGPVEAAVSEAAAQAAVNARVMADERMKPPADGETPLDGKRMIFGGFEAFVER